MIVKRWVRATGVVVVALLAGACADLGMTGVTRVAADTYRISRVDGGGRYADAAAMRTAVISDADTFARSRGRIAVPVATREETMRVGHMATIDYDFRLAAAGEPAPTPAEPVRQPAAVASETPHAAVEAQPAAKPEAKPEAKPDLYSDLIKLDELRKRGILTEAEFQMLKARLLAK